MGYTTDFDGSFKLDKPLTQAHREYLEDFSKTRRMRRDPKALKGVYDPVREAAGLPLGDEGCYFVGAADRVKDESPYLKAHGPFRAGDNCYGQQPTPDIVSPNDEPRGQPGLWCQWRPTGDGTAIVWSGTEKFYHYVEWLKYLIEHFLKPWGYTLNGEVSWQGEDPKDCGRIIVTVNEVATDRYYPPPGVVQNPGQALRLADSNASSELVRTLLPALQSASADLAVLVRTRRSEALLKLNKSVKECLEAVKEVDNEL